MVRRSTRILLEVFIGFLAGLALLIGVTVWRLSQEPLHLDFLSPYLEAALTGNDSGVIAEIGDTVLILGDKSRTLDLRARQVRLRDSDGFTIATLPEVSVNLSLRALIHGVVAPTRIDIIGARVTLLRDRDGKFNFRQRGSDEEGAQRTAEDEADFSILVPRLVTELLSEPDPGRPLSFLRVARIIDGQLTVYDRKLRTLWHAPSASVELRRDAQGLTGDMELSLALGPSKTDLGLNLIYSENEGVTIVAVEFEDLRLERFGALDERLAPLSGIEVPLRGSVSAVVEDDGFFRSLVFDLTGGPGVVTLPDMLPEPLALEQMVLRGHLDGASETLELETASLEFAPNPGLDVDDGPTATIKGSAAMREGDLQIEVEGKVMDMPADDLGRYWPLPLAPAGRKWVTANIRGGTAESGTIATSLSVPAGDWQALEVLSLSGGYRFRNLNVHYLRPMPPVTVASGSAIYDQSHMSFALSGGTLGDIVVPKADVKIDFSDRSSTIFINLAAAGPLRSALELLDHERLQLTSKLGIRPEDSRGSADARVQFQFPLVSDLNFAQVEVSVNAKLTDVGVKQVVFGKDAENATLDLRLNTGGMTVRGPLEMDGLPAELVWHENFQDDGKATRVFDVQAPHLDEQDLAEFSLDLRPYLSGPVAASLVYVQNPDRSADLDVVLDLERAEFDLPFIYWSKAPGTGGQLSLGINLLDDEVVAIERIDMRAGTLRAFGHGLLDETGSELARLDLDEFQFGQSLLSGVTAVIDGETVAVHVEAGILDAAPFMAGQTTAQTEPSDGQVAEGDTDVFTVVAPDLDVLIFGEGRHLETVTLKLDRRARGWEEIFVEAKIPETLWTEVEPEVKPKSWIGQRNANRTESLLEGGPAQPEDDEPAVPAEAPLEDRFFRMHYRSAGQGGYRLKVLSNDTGALLRALDLRDTVLGGQLDITGTSDGPIPYHTLSGRFEVADFAMVGAPTLAKILTVASLTGLSDTLSGKGIWFDRFKGNFTLDDGVVRSDLLHAHGPALGVTAKGTINFNTARLKLEGTVVPAYAVNRFIGLIPGLGPLLTGGQGGGILAFTYKMKGTYDDPNVSVNPLSVLAPGFLRGLFGGIDGEAPSVFPDGPTR